MAELVITGAGNLSITGADLNVSCITVGGTAVLHSIRLRPDVAVVTEVSPSARLSVRAVGGVLPLTHGGQGPVRLPGVSPVPTIEGLTYSVELGRMS